MAIRFRCTQCRKPLSIASRKAGKEIACPICQTTLTVPLETSVQGITETEPVQGIGASSDGATEALAPPAAVGIIVEQDNPFALPAPRAGILVGPNPVNEQTPPPLVSLSTERKKRPTKEADPTWRAVAIIGGFAFLLLAILIPTIIIMGKDGPESPDPVAQKKQQDPPDRKSAPVFLPAKKANPDDLSPKQNEKPPQDPLVGKENPKPKDPVDIKEKPPEIIEKKFEFEKRPEFVEPKKPLIELTGPKDDKPPVVKQAFIIDNFGNPQGPNVGLAREMEFKGKRLLIWSGCPTEFPYIASLDNPLWKALQAKGFTLKVIGGRFQIDWLKDTDQFWLFSSNIAAMDEKGFKAVEAYARSGKGLYILADNAPYLAEADVLAKRLFGTTIVGDYPGQKIAYVKQRNLTQPEIQKFGGQFAVDDHPLLTGVNFLYEGITISHVKPTTKLEVAIRASDGNILVALAKDKNLRVAVDCGFTRYYYGGGGQDFVTRTAGTIRFGENMAAFLLRKNKE